MASFKEWKLSSSLTAHPVEIQSLHAAAGVSIVDLEILTEEIWHDLQGQVDQATVHQVLVDLLPNYQAARVQTFVPILIRREAIDILSRQP